jgi:tetratricopeptide (TPR) repeat protein
MKALILPITASIQKRSPRLTRQLSPTRILPMRGENAGTHWADSIAINPEYASAWNSRGIALGHLGRHSEAVVSYNKAITISPHDVKIWNNRGNAFIRLGQHENALASFDRAIAINPEYTVAQKNREIAVKNKPGRS